MPREPTAKSRPFTAFTSAHDESCMQSNVTVEGPRPKFHSALDGAIATPSEVTELERRLIAHERILRALIGYLADNDGEILASLKARLGNSQASGEYEPNYVSTADYDDHFIQSIEAEARRRKYDAR